MEKLRVLHIITGLGNGGAERMLFNLIENRDGESFTHQVVSLKPGGRYENKIKELGIPVFVHDFSQPLYFLRTLGKLKKHIKSYRPHIIQTWMYHGNFISVLLPKNLLRQCSLYWNIHHSLTKYSEEKYSTRLMIRLNRRYAARTTGIIYCSAIAAAQHESFGFDHKKTHIIPNGFNLADFAPDARTREQVRTELGLASTCCLIGLVGRYHPLKDHPNFIEAIHILKTLASDKNWKSLLVGRDINDRNTGLINLIDRYDVKDRLILHEEADNIADIMKAFDVLCLSSSSEAFPNVVGEAMATAVPCVVTDVGDASLLVGDSGVVVPSGDAGALAEGLLRLVSADSQIRKTLGERARKRIQDFFSIQLITRQYEDLYKNSTAG